MKFFMSNKRKKIVLAIISIIMVISMIVPLAMSMFV